MERNEIIRRAKWPFIFLLVVAGAAGVILYYFLFIKVEPGPLLESALNKAHQAKSYRYTLNSELDMGGKKQNWIQVQGEQAEESYHFQGEM
jgi:hypothetical protein